MYAIPRWRAPLFITITAAVLCGTVAPVWAQSKIEKEFTMTSGGALALDADRGSVTVKGVPGSKARVVVTVTTGDVESYVDLKFAQLDGRLDITAKKKGSDSILSWLMPGGRADLRFAIEVPEATQVTVATGGGPIDLSSTRGAAVLDTSGGSIRASRVAGTVSADTSGGSITLEEIDGDVVADTSGGSIRLQSVRGNATADTSGGAIHAAGITGDLRADTSGGSIHIEDVGGRAVAETSGGSINASLARGNSRGGTLEASGGGIRVVLDPSVNLVIEAEASGGSVSADLPFTGEVKTGKHRLRGTLGQGGERLVLHSSGGPIRIEKP